MAIRKAARGSWVGCHMTICHGCRGQLPRATEVLILPRKRTLDADRRSLALVGYDTRIVTRLRLGIDRQRRVTDRIYEGLSPSRLRVGDAELPASAFHSPAPPRPQPPT